MPDSMKSDYLNERGLEKIRNIQKQLSEKSLSENDRMALLQELSYAEDLYYSSKRYSLSLPQNPDYSKPFKIYIWDNFDDDRPLFHGYKQDLIQLIEHSDPRYGIYHLFLNIKNPLIVEHPKPKSENDSVYYWANLDINIGDGRPVKTRYAAKYAQDNGYDGVIITNIYDHGPYSGDPRFDPISPAIREQQELAIEHDDDSHPGVDTRWLETSDIFIAFESNQVKSAGGENTGFSKTNNNIHFFKDSKGVVYGYVDNHGNIHLDKNKIRPEHPIHEYTHIWDRVVASKNPSLWIRGVELMKQFNGGKLWNEIANSEFYGKKWSNMSDAQREFMIASEVHARLVGEGGAKLISEIEAKQGSSDIISKLKDWILKFWQSLKQTFSNWSKEDIETLTLKDFNHMTLRDFVTSNAEVAYNESDAPLSTAEKLRLVGLVKHDYEGDIDVDEEVQRAIDKLNTVSPNEQQYITPVITGKSVINGVSLIDAINIAAKIYNSENILGTISNKSLREKIQQIDDEQLRERLYNILDLGVPNEVMFMIADYISYNDTRGIVANYICDFLENVDDDTPYDDIAVPIIESIDVKYDDSREQSLFNDDIMKHCKGN